MECEILSILKDVIIGLISGGISSLIVSILLKKRWDKEDYIQQFKDDKQAYCRYLQRIRDELLIALKHHDAAFVVRSIENEPIRETFKDLTEQNKQEINDIDKLLSEIKEFLLCPSNNLDEKKYKYYSGKLFQYSVHVLQFQIKEL